MQELDFQDPESLISKLLVKVPETALDLRHINDTLVDAFNDEMPEVGEVHESVAINDSVTTDILCPHGDGPFPVLVYLHGGAWVAGSPGHYAKLSRRFAEAGFLTFTVDYRLAPEHPFPAAYNDCCDALRWVSENCHKWGGAPDRIAVGGDSAGGNLSAAMCYAAAQEGGVQLNAAVLIYGAFDFDMMLKRQAKTDDDERVNLANRIASEAYLGDEISTLVHDPRVSPLKHVAGFPPCHVVVGGLDALAVQADALIEEFKKHDIEYEYFVDDLMPHGYLQMEMLPDSKPAFDRIVDFLNRHINADAH